MNPLPKWVSIHVPFTSNAAAFCLLYALQELLSCAPERYKRFFYLRICDDCDHLRIRVQLSRNTDVEVESHRLLEYVTGIVSKNGPRSLEEARLMKYERASLYFGETRDTLYSELLNVSSSALSIRLNALCSQQGVVYSRGLVGAILFAIVLRATASPDEAILLVTQCRILDALPEVTSFSRLLKRACRELATLRSPVHAIHLFCNKSNLSVQDETCIYDAALASLLSARTHLRLEAP